MVEKKTPRSISLTESQRRKLDDLGGSAWVQRAIEEAYERLPKIERSRPLPAINYSQPLRFRRFVPVVMNPKPTTKGKKK